MGRIDTDARYFKKWYDEVSEIPEPGDKWVLNDGKSKGTVKAVEPLYQCVENDINDEYYMYDFYKIIFGDIELGIEIEDEEPETEIIVYTVAPEYRFDEDIKEIVEEVYNKNDRMQKEFEDLEEFENSLDECDNNTEILQAIASKIGKQELIEIVAHYDYHLEWAIKEILK